jgi:hypothetical protein
MNGKTKRDYKTSPRKFGARMEKQGEIIRHVQENLEHEWRDMER